MLIFNLSEFDPELELEVDSGRELEGLGLVAVGVGASSEGEASPLLLLLLLAVSNLSSFFPPNSLFWSFFALILVSSEIVFFRRLVFGACFFSGRELLRGASEGVGGRTSYAEWGV